MAAEDSEQQLVRLCDGLIPATYIKQGQQAIAKRRGLLRRLLEHRRIPDEGWDEASIELALEELALMDSNNFMDSVGVGEREARVYSSLVARRHYRFAHGMGRSGDIAEPQPKAAGSSLAVRLTNVLVLDALRVAGLDRVKECMVLPVATGMSMALVLLSLRPTKPQARYVLWPRIDQKSCLKAIITAGLDAVVLPLQQDGDELKTDLEALSSKLHELGAENVLCVLSTTSCFAPRAPDSVVEISQLCAEHHVAHVINNAYGLQCSKITHAINEACRVGRVDVVVQSTDKNFLVPVGGAVVASPGPSVIARVCKSYPGRASSSPITDVFITLLSMGRSGYRALLKERKELVKRFTEGLAAVAQKHGGRLLLSPRNTISFAISLQGLAGTKSGREGEESAPSPSDVSFLGSMLFMRCVSGTRVVPVDQIKSVGPFQFKGYGAHFDAYPVPYLTAACAIGVTRREVDEFLVRLDKAFTQFRKKSTAIVRRGEVSTLERVPPEDHQNEVEVCDDEVGCSAENKEQEIV